MNSRLSRPLLLLLGAGILMGLFVIPSSAFAGNCSYGVFTIENPTQSVIHYDVRWGNGPWRSICVYPGQSFNHSLQLDENGQVPIPQVRFDWIAGDGLTTYRVYTMHVFATNHPNSTGKRYHLRYSSCGRYVFLYQR